MRTVHDAPPVAAVLCGDAVHQCAAGRTTGLGEVGVRDFGGVGQLGLGLCLRRCWLDSGGTQQSLAFAEVALAVTVAVTTAVSRLDETSREDVQ